MHKGYLAAKRSNIFRLTVQWHWRTFNALSLRLVVWDWLARCQPLSTTTGSNAKFEENVNQCTFNPQCAWSKINQIKQIKNSVNFKIKNSWERKYFVIDYCTTLWIAIMTHLRKVAISILSDHSSYLSHLLGILPIHLLFVHSSLEIKTRRGHISFANNKKNTTGSFIVSFVF